MTISPNASTVWRDYETDGVPSSGNHKVKKSAARTWGTAVETVLNAFTTNGGLIFATKTLMDAQAATYTEPRSAWVYADSTASNNGVYVLNPTTDTWTKVGRLPYDFVIGTDTGAGTANAIQITTDIPVADGMIVAFSLFEATTSSPVTVSINGGAALALKTNRGINASALTANMEIWGRIRSSDGTFRMLNDQDVSALVVQAEAARDDAIAAQAAAEAAAASINLPAVLTPDTIPVTNAAGTARVDETFDDVRQLLGLGDFAHPFIDNIPNYDPTASATRLLIEGSTENGGSPVYHRHFGTIERDNIGRLHVYYRRALGHATYFEGGIYGVRLEHNGQERSAEFEVVAPVAGYDISDPRLTLLPNGNMLLIWQELPITSPGVVGTPVVFKAKLSIDNGANWGTPYTIFSCDYSYCRMFGAVKIISDYGAGGRWRLALTAYYRVTLDPSLVHTAIFYSDDEGATFVEGTPIYAGTLGYNETAVAFANTSIGIAVMRVNPADGFYVSRTFDGGTTWSALAKLTAIETQAVAPSLDIVTKDGEQYVLLGYCDRTDNVTKWRWERLKKAMSSNAAFSTNAKITSATDMIEASGYQATKIFPTGQVLFVEFAEYAYNTTISDPVGSDVRLVYKNLLELVGGEEAFTPTLSGSTTPGTPVGSFTGTLRKAPDGLVTGMLRIALTSKGGMAGQLKIGLPYANRSGTRYRSGGTVTSFTNVTLADYGQPYAFIASGSSTIDLWKSRVATSGVTTATTGIANLNAADVDDTFTIELAFSYFTDG